MALVVTANEIDRQTGVDEDGVSQKPYQYRNYLKETITIPEDSEVAVQSVKFSRDETATVRDGDKWYQMYNINLENLDDGRTSKDTTGYPIVCQLANPGEISNLPITEVAERITTQQRRGFPHPDVMYKVVDDDKTPITKLEYGSGVTQAWDGFSIRQTNYASALGLDTKDKLINYTKLYKDEDASLTYDAPSQTFIAPTIASQPKFDNIGQITDLPISHYKGHIRFDLAGIQTDESAQEDTTECNCAMGLCRAFDRSPTDMPENDIQPDYFQPDDLDGVDGGILSPDDEGSIQYFDFGFRIEPEGSNINSLRRLKVVCACSNGDDDDWAGKTVMKQIKYWDWTDSYMGTSKFSEQYDIDNNTLGINQLMIRIDGEQVLFYYHTGVLSTSANPLSDSGWVLFCGYQMDGGNYWKTDGSNNENIPPPIKQTQWMMYPQVYISDQKIDRSGKGGSPDENGKLQITGYSGRDATDHEYFAPRNDWWARSVLDTRNGSGLESQDNCAEVDTREKFSNPWREPKTLYTQLASTTNRQMNGFCWALTLTPDADEYYVEAKDSNVDELFGFTDVRILQPSAVGGAFDTTHGWMYDSLHVPELMSDSSLFIRLDNFTQKILNGAVERPSKILYHIPRFDSSNRSHGDGLYFEPHERVYVKLNNPRPITINEFDLTICNVGEILATDLKGQTIIILHFRENQTGGRQSKFLAKEKDEGVFSF
tara:strand:- start:13383 stop:15521 length:2139 start_codon:yes stop_codon:yes gene_type:complete